MGRRWVLLVSILVPAIAGAADGFLAEIPGGAGAPWGPGYARSLGLKPGDRITVDCRQGDYAEPIWGDGVYAEESSVCAAAVHAGVIDPERGGRVAIVLSGARETFAGIRRNGLDSAPFGRSGGSFSFPDALRFQPERTGRAMRIDWGSTASPWRGEIGRRLDFDCEPRRDGAAVLSPLLGNEAYRDESSICAAALHAGQITAAGGRVSIEIAQAGGGFVFPGAAPMRRMPVATPTPAPQIVASLAPVRAVTSRRRSRPELRVDFGAAPGATPTPAPVVEKGLSWSAAMTAFSPTAGRANERLAPGFSAAVRSPLTGTTNIGMAVGWRRLSTSVPRDGRTLGYEIQLEFLPVEATAQRRLTPHVAVQAGLGVERLRASSRAGTAEDWAPASSVEVNVGRAVGGGRGSATAGYRVARHATAARGAADLSGVEFALGYERRF